MSHRFPPPDHIELELTAAEETQEWFDEWFGAWLSDQSDTGYDIALAEVERRELAMRGNILADLHKNRKLERGSINPPERRQHERLGTH